MADKWAELRSFLSEEYTGEPGIYAIQPYDKCVFVIASNQAQADRYIPEAQSDHDDMQLVVVLWSGEMNQQWQSG